MVFDDFEFSLLRSKTRKCREPLLTTLMTERNILILINSVYKARTVSVRLTTKSFFSVSRCIHDCHSQCMALLSLRNTALAKRSSFIMQERALNSPEEKIENLYEANIVRLAMRYYSI